MRKRTAIRHLPLLMAALLVGAAPAWGAPDESGSVDVAEPNGSPPFCEQPCYTVTKSFEYYAAGNPDAPAGAACGSDNTYIYQLTHIGGTGPFVPALTAFELAVSAADVTSAGEIPGFGISPGGTTVQAGAVLWDFQATPIPDGASSTKLFVCSPLIPGTVNDTMVSIDGQLALDAPGTCVGPQFEGGPPGDDGEPIPCTIGFWKNRADGKRGTLQHFPDPEFDQVVSQAVSLSGEFMGPADLLAALAKQGNRTHEERRAQQLAALLLNFAAGDLDSQLVDNDKCQLFDLNAISSNSCGDGITVGQALMDILSGSFATAEGAKNCADDINNGIGVVGTNSGE